MSKHLRIKITALLIVVAASMIVMGALLTNMQSSLSHGNYDEEMKQEAVQLERLLAEADEETVQNTEQFDAIYQSKAAQVAYMAQNDAGYAETDAKMIELRELLDVDNLFVTDRDGKPLSENFYWRATRRGDYTALNTLAPARLQVRSKLTAGGDRKVIRTTVRNTGRSVAFAIHLQPYRLSDGERILPYEADDNYFTLLPGESRTIDFRFDGSLLPDDRYEVRAEAYNR